jgi:DNA-binding LacI/PurR family transcriptional regulator
LRAAKRHGIRLAVDFLSVNDELPPLIKAGRVDGLLLNGPGPGDQMLNQLKHLPAMRMFSRDPFHWGDRTLPNHRHVGRLAFEYFQKSGCRSVCCITSDFKEDRYWRDRAHAFQLAARVAGVPCEMLGEHEPEAHSQQAEFLAAERRVEELTRLPNRPDALFVANGFGPYVYEHLRRAGIRPMEDIQLVIGDFQMCSHYLDPDPVKVDIHAEEVGRLAFEFLLARIAAPNGPRLTHFVEPDLLLPGQLPRRLVHSDLEFARPPGVRSPALG